MIICGIDPGKSGALAILDGNAVTVKPMPLACDTVDADGTWAILQQLKSDSTDRQVPLFIAIEKSQPMPKQGCVSTFNYGVTTGILLGQIIAVRPSSWTLVRPRDWQKDAWLGTDSKLGNKERSLQAVMRLFPDLEIQRKGPRSKKFHDGIVDALCIAWWARKNIY